MFASQAAAALEIDVRADTGPAERGLARMSGVVRSSASSMMGGLGLIAGAAGAGAVVAGLGRAVMAGSDLMETGNKLAVVFGPATDRVNGFIDRMADRFGLVKNEMGEAISNIGLIAKGAGLAEGPAANMGMTMARLAADASSFYNVPVADALGAIRSGLVGEAEPLRQFGVLLSESAVQAEAVRLGLANQGDELTETQKIMARSSLIQRGFADATGDLERTQGGLANRVRELKGRFSNFIAEMGARAIPTLLGAWDAAERLAGVVGPILSDALDSARPALSAIGDALGTVVGAIGDFIAEDPRPFLVGAAAAAGVLALALAQVAIASLAAAAPFLLVVAAVGLIAGGLYYAYTHFEGFRNVVDSVAAWLVGTAWPMIQQFAAGLVAAFNSAVEWVRSVWPDVAVIVGAYLEVVRRYITTVVAVVRAVWNQWGDEVVATVVAAWSYVREYVNAALDFVRGVIALVSSVIQGDWGRAWQSVRAILRAAWDAIFALLRFAATQVVNIIRGLGPLLAGAMRGAWNLATSAARAAAGGLVSFVGGLPGRILSALGDLGGLLTSVGGDIIDGLVRGIQNAWHRVTDLIGNLASRLPGPVRDVLGINSPSRVFAEVGAGIPEGLALGITSGAGAAVGAARALAGDLAATRTSVPALAFTGAGPASSSSAGADRLERAAALLERAARHLGELERRTEEERRARGTGSGAGSGNMADVVTREQAWRGKTSGRGRTGGVR